MSTYEVTGTTSDGQRDTRRVEAADEWKARTVFMAFTTLKPQGQRVDYQIAKVA